MLEIYYRRGIFGAKAPCCLRNEKLFNHVVLSDLHRKRFGNVVLCFFVLLKLRDAGSAQVNLGIAVFWPAFASKFHLAFPNKLNIDIVMAYCLCRSVPLKLDVQEFTKKGFTSLGRWGWCTNFGSWRPTSNTRTSGLYSYSVVRCIPWKEATAIFKFLFVWLADDSNSVTIDAPFMPIKGILLVVRFQLVGWRLNSFKTF